MFQKFTVGLYFVLMAIGAAHAAVPQAIIIKTHIAFLPLGEGTFTATAPLCASGTFRATDSGFFITNRPHQYTGRAEYTCDDNSGTFIIQLHPQFHADPVFTVNGPWSIWGKGTGRYAGLSGHGDFGAIIDVSHDPLIGEETFIGFVELN
jgi:hypothetical protein